MVIANRVPCQTSVLPRILKRHIGQVENLQLLIRSIYSRSLEKQGEMERERERQMRKPQPLGKEQTRHREEDLNES